MFKLRPGFILFWQGFLAFSLCAAEQIERQEICAGVEYCHKTVSEVPWSVHVLKVERHRKDLNVVTTLPQGKVIGLEKLSDQVQAIPPEFGKAIGGINGDFFSWRKGPYQGDPAGLQIMNGELVSGPHGKSKGERGIPQGIACFWVDDKAGAHIETVEPHFQVTFPGGKKLPFRLNAERTNHEAVLYTHIAGTSTRTTNGMEIVLERAGFNRWLPLQIGEKYKARVQQIGTTNSVLTINTLVLSIGPKLQPRLPKIKPGDVVQISTATSPDLKNTMTAIGGGPVLVRNGKIQKFKTEPHRDPRTAMGFNRTHYFFVVVDGRRLNVSDGMTFPELAQEMASWGCTEALNLDGGGSAMLWATGELKNQPSDNRGERPNANSLIVVRKEMEVLSSRGKNGLQRGAERLLQ